MRVNAAPIPPPEGYPKFNQSAKIVSSSLAEVGVETVDYVIEVRNTGASAAETVIVTDHLPISTTYISGAYASAGSEPIVEDGVFSWQGPVGFDETVYISYSLNIDPDFSGVLENSAVISHLPTEEVVTVTARTVVTNDPILTISKSSFPDKPGPNRELTYQIEVLNNGQPGEDIPIIVTDTVPEGTTFVVAGEDGEISETGDLVTWERTVDLNTGDTTIFTYTVMVQNVPNETVISNTDYAVYNSNELHDVGEVYTVTVVTPEFLITKETLPDPPGSNGEMVYQISAINLGSSATGITITDRLPSQVTYVDGGTFDNEYVSWYLPGLDTNERITVSYTVEIGDIAAVPIVNDEYNICDIDGICGYGQVLTSTVFGPTFRVTGWVDPISKKPGGGGDGGGVTATLVLENLGPGSALDASALLTFERISVQEVILNPSMGTISILPDSGGKFIQYAWTGDLTAGEAITFTNIPEKNTIGGEEGTHYTATLVITDQLGTYITEPISGTAVGNITHYPNLIPTKTSPPFTSPGKVLTYTIDVFNSGQGGYSSAPVLTETIPASTTLEDAGDGTESVNGRTITWILPELSTGEHTSREFSVRIPEDLISGSLIVNDLYGTTTYSGTVPKTIAGEPITTVVKEVGLIDSYKTVSPEILRPGIDNLLTYTIHVVNSGPDYLEDVHVFDQLPWQFSTYQRDAEITAGNLISDIVSLVWTGDVGPFSEETITYHVLVDPGFEGTMTNMVVIDHPSLIQDAVLATPANVTDKPLLQIHKTAAPNPVRYGEEILYTIRVVNTGQLATHLEVSDPLPAGSVYMPGTATSGGFTEQGQLHWDIEWLDPGESEEFTFRVRVEEYGQIINENYQVYCYEGVTASGPPVIVDVIRDGWMTYLPLVSR